MKLMTTKPLRYANRSMATGTEFSAGSRDARLLVAIGKARLVDEAAVEAELTELRAEYQNALGKRPYHGWDADTLKQKIADAKG